MRKLILALVIVFTVTAVLPLIAQTQPMTHKKVSDEMTFATDLKFGTHVLPAGRYRIDCDHVKIRFTNIANGKTLELPCEGKELDKKAQTTELYTQLGADGVRSVDKMYLRGSAVEHVFVR